MSSPVPARHPSGAYGLVVEGLTGDPARLGLQRVPCDAAPPTIRLAWRRLAGRRPSAHAVDADRAVVLLVGGGYATVERSSSTATIWTRTAIDEPDLVHPYLGLPAGVMALWAGRSAFHGGGFVTGGRAWGVLGDRAAGKTTLLAHLHRRGVDVLADDMIVVAGGDAFAGPRTLDLRPATAQRWHGSEELVPVRGSERHRLLLPPTTWTVPFGGWVVLEQAPEIAVEAVPVADRFRHLERQHMMGVNNPRTVLDLLTKPMWRLRRPRRWAALDASADRILAVLQRS